MRRASTRVVAAAVAVVAVSAGATSAATRKAPEPAHHAAVYIAHLRLQLSSTSNWSTVQLFPGLIVSSKLTDTSGPGTWHAGTTKLTMSGGRAGQSTGATVDVIYDDLATEPNGHLTLQKGSAGLTHVVVRNVSGPHATLVCRATDTISGGNPQNTSVVGITRSRIMGDVAAPLPRADPRKLVLAFYYPWYHSYGLPGMADHPRQARSTFTKAGVDSMTAQAKAHGIDGFIVSWAGRHDDGDQLRLALEAARSRHQLVTGYLESAIAASHGAAAESAELHWLAELLQFSRSPAFLKTKSGVPVVFVYQMATFSPGQWQAILHQLRDTYHKRVRLVGDAVSAPYRRLEWGVHYYGAVGSEAGIRSVSVTDSLASKARSELHPATRPQLFAAAVSPGFDDRKLRGEQHPVVPRDGGQRYLQTWRAALAGEPDWVLVTSWNEWFEDTEVEPGQDTGSQALRLTRLESARWKRH